MSISLVINTRNEAINLSQCIRSVGPWVDEVIVVDMESTDGTASVAAQLRAKVFRHPHVGYVEPARNFALSKATGDWILILDADEEVSRPLLDHLYAIMQSNRYDYVSIPRKNLIFNQWIQHSGWWPDYNIRFFKKGSVTWKDEIHSRPTTFGEGAKINPDPEHAIIHHHYQSVSQYVERLNRYTDHQLKILEKSDYQFYWSDLLSKPANEFFRRYFAEHGYKDGLHGLALALLQSFSELVLYLKAWERSGFISQEIPKREFSTVSTTQIKDFLWWLSKSHGKSGKLIQSYLLKTISKFL